MRHTCHALLACLLALALFGSAGAARLKVLAPSFSAQAIAAGQASTSAAIDLSAIYPDGFIGDGYFSVQVVIAGSGTAKLEYTVSNYGVTFVTPEGTVAIISGKTAGTYHATIPLPACKAFKLVATETGGAQAVTVTATVVVI